MSKSKKGKKPGPKAKRKNHAHGTPAMKKEILAINDGSEPVKSTGSTALKAGGKAKPAGDALSSQQSASGLSENRPDTQVSQKGTDMADKKSKKPAAKEAGKKEKVVAAPGTNTAAEMEFLAQSGKDGAEIYQDIAELSPEMLKEAQANAQKLVDKQDAELKAASAKKEAAKSEKKAEKPAKEEKVVAAPGTDTAAEMEFLAQTGEDGGKIYQAIAELDPELLAESEKKADAYVKKMEAEPEPAAKEEKKAKKPAASTVNTAENTPKGVAAPGIDTAAEMEFLAQTGEDGGKIYQAIAELDPELLAESEKKADAYVKKLDEEQKASTKEEKVVAAPGTDTAAEMEFLAQTGEDGGKIYQAIAELDPELLVESEKKADALVEKQDAPKKAEPEMSEADKKIAAMGIKKAGDIKTTKVEGAYSNVSQAPKKPQLNMDLSDEALNSYKSFSNDTLFEMAQALGLEMSLDELTSEIAKAENLEDLAVNLIINSAKPGKEFVFEEDGFDSGLIPVLIKRIGDTLPFKASDLMDLSHDIDKLLARNLGEDGMENAALYNQLFDQVRSILMRGQQLGVTNIEELDTSDDHKLRKLIEHFMDVAYNLLPYWQYNDVKYYEGFIFAVLSQFADLADLHNRTMMDVADLYIKHGDYGRGDADYNYLLRENNLKDQIYYRFANVYRPIDWQKAKNIAGSSLQYVDDRYTYYPQLIEILEN